MITRDNRDVIRKELKSNHSLLACVIRAYGIEYQEGKNTRCPYCGGTDFGAYETQYGEWRYKCLSGRCGKTGDVIQLYQDYKHIDHNTALEELSRLAHVDMTKPMSGNPQAREKGTGTGTIKKPVTPSAEWISTLTHEIKYWNEWLINGDAPAYKYARKYLTETRGLSMDTLKRHNIGFNQRPRTFDIDGKRINVPCGTIIPKYLNGDVISVNIRTVPQQDWSNLPNTKYYLWACRWAYPTNHKYHQVLESKPASALYNASAVVEGCDVICVEGELDALSIESVTDEVIPVTLNSASYRLNPWDIETLSKARSIRIVGDNDKAGSDGANKALTALSHHPNVELCHYPQGYKDANEILQRDPRLLRDCLSEWFTCW